MKLLQLTLSAFIISTILSSCNVDCSEMSIVNTNRLEVDDKTELTIGTIDDLYNQELVYTYDISTSVLTGRITLQLKDSMISFDLSFEDGDYSSSKTIRFAPSTELYYSTEDEEFGIPREMLEDASLIRLYIMNFYPFRFEAPRNLSFPQRCDYIYPVQLARPTNWMSIRFSGAPSDTTGNPGNPVITGATGQLEMEPLAPEVGDDITIRVIDADLNLDNSIAESFSVEASSDKNETETVVLTETGINTGIFEGIVSTTLGTSAGTNDDGVFNAEDNTEISVSYDDQLDASGNNPNPITKSVTLSEPPPSLSFSDFLNKNVILDSTVTYNGTTINPANIASVTKALSLYLPDASSGCGGTPAPGQCYGFEYEFINGTTNKFDVYYNTDFNYCNCATDATPAFSNEFTFNGNVLSINSGTGFENWTLSIDDSEHFRIHILSGGGTQVSERYYSIKR